MFIETQRHIGTFPIVVIARNVTRIRLAGTCFRPTAEPLAGNFAHIRSVQDLLDAECGRVLADLAEDVERRFRASGRGTYRLQVQLDKHVGWASTAPIESIAPSELEEFRPNRRSRAKRVISTSAQRAPKTNLVTIVYQIEKEPRQIAALIHSVYPGPDVGELKGDVSDREGVAFFGWDHPGEA